MVLKLMDSLILATDFTQHKKYLDEFDERLGRGIDIDDTEDRIFVLKVSTHTMLCVCVCVCVC